MRIYFTFQINVCFTEINCFNYLWIPLNIEIFAKNLQNYF